MNKSKGITLIALVVTIVVLLILAGISINLVLGENGIINRAKEAARETEIAKVKDEITAILGEWSIENATKGTGLKDFLDEKVNLGELDKVTETEDGYDIEKDGVVISIDKNGNIIGDIIEEPQKPATLPQISNIKVVANSDGTGENLAAQSVEEGQAVYIVFEASIEGGTITSITKDGENITLPYAVTNNGEYTFVVSGTVNGEVKTENVTVTVNQFYSVPKVGDYVNYTYDTAPNYILTEAICGSSNNPTEGIPQTKGLKWRIFNINDDGSMDLISAKPTESYVWLGRALGYNNGVYLINDICEKQYSNKTLGVTARNLTIKDIEDQMNSTGIAERNSYGTTVQYGKTKTYTGSQIYYPNLYAKENGSGINTTTVKTNGIERSDKYYTKPTTETQSQADANVITVTQDFYDLSSISSSWFDNSNIHSMIFGTGWTYWLAQRWTRALDRNYNVWSSEEYSLQATGDISSKHTLRVTANRRRMEVYFVQLYRFHPV